MLVVLLRLSLMVTFGIRQASLRRRDPRLSHLKKGIKEHASALLVHFFLKDLKSNEFWRRIERVLARSQLRSHEG